MGSQGLGSTEVQVDTGGYIFIERWGSEHLQKSKRYNFYQKRY